jgi:coenzyme F420-dependent glucose-6-phosphate dehydrogenase
MALTLGYKASAEQFGPRELLEFSVLAEEVGFDSVVVSDHFQPWRHNGGHAPYSFAWLAALGERTRWRCSTPGASSWGSARASR